MFMEEQPTLVPLSQGAKVSKGDALGLALRKTFDLDRGRFLAARLPGAASALSCCSETLNSKIGVWVTALGLDRTN